MGLGFFSISIALYFRWLFRRSLSYHLLSQLGSFLGGLSLGLRPGFLRFCLGLFRFGPVLLGLLP